MEKVTDILKELKIRLTSPLFSSFLFSWLIINWRIPVGLIWYKLADLKLDDYDSYFDLIEKQRTCCNFFLLPAIGASMYIIGYPILRNWIQVYQAYSTRWGNRRTEKASNDIRIPVSSFTKQKAQLRQLEEDLATAVQDETKTLREKRISEDRVKELELSFAEKDRQYQNFVSSGTVQYFNGNWEITHLTAAGVQKVAARIQNGDIFVYDENGQTTILARMARVAYESATGNFVIRLNHTIVDSAGGISNKEQYYAYMKNNESEFSNSEGSPIIHLKRV